MHNLPALGPSDEPPPYKIATPEFLFQQRDRRTIELTGKSLDQHARAGLRDVGSADPSPSPPPPPPPPPHDDGGDNNGDGDASANEEEDFGGRRLHPSGLPPYRRRWPVERAAKPTVPAQAWSTAQSTLSRPRSRTASTHLTAWPAKSFWTNATDRPIPDPHGNGVRIGEADTPAPYEPSRRSLLSHAPDGWMRTNTPPHQPAAFEHPPGPSRRAPNLLVSARPLAASQEGAA